MRTRTRSFSLDKVLADILYKTQNTRRTTEAAGGGDFYLRVLRYATWRRTEEEKKEELYEWKNIFANVNVEKIESSYTLPAAEGSARTH